MATITVDPEKSVASATANPVRPSWSSSVPNSTNVNNLGGHTSLEIFQFLVGLHTPRSLTQEGISSGRATNAKSKRARDDNVGLYHRAKQQERTSRIAYVLTSFINNFLFMFQILLAATFTALSAYKDSHPATLTALGAVNTVIAGCLAWQKGMGVPQRYRKAQDEYQALVHEIENAERSFLHLETTGGEEGVKLDPRTEKDRLQKLFEKARADQQANYPDLYVSTGAVAAKSSDDSAQKLEDVKAEVAKVQSELVAKIEALMSKLEGRATGPVENAAPSDSKA